MSGGLSIHCVWCKAPLLDVEHAKEHVRRCAAAPWTAEIALLTRERDEARAEVARLAPLPALHPSEWPSRGE